MNSPMAAYAQVSRKSPSRPVRISGMSTILMVKEAKMPNTASMPVEHQCVDHQCQVFAEDDLPASEW